MIAFPLVVASASKSHPETKIKPCLYKCIAFPLSDMFCVTVKALQSHKTEVAVRN